MYIPYSELANSSRVWIYKANRIFSDKEEVLISKKLLGFCNDWKAHQNQLKSSFKLVENCFLILLVFFLFYLGLQAIFRSKKIKKEYYNARELLKLCRKKKFTFLVSSSYIIAKSLGADGVHYPSIFRNCIQDKKLLITCSYHGYHDVKRIKQLHAKMVFISPIFLTNSDINKKERGKIYISFLANYIKTQYSVLGGVRENNIISLRNRGICSISGLDIIFDINKYKC